LEVVSNAKNTSINAASKLYNIDRKQVRNWKNDEQKLIDMK
jgi:hypothetical protein